MWVETDISDTSALRVPLPRPVRRELPLAAIVLGLLVLHGVWVLARLSTAVAHARAPGQVAALRIDPNVASAAELELLPGIGPTIARNIVAFRETTATKQPFRSPADLDNVKRIGPAIIAEITPFLTFSPRVAGDAQP